MAGDFFVGSIPGLCKLGRSAPFYFLLELVSPAYWVGADTPL